MKKIHRKLRLDRQTVRTLADPALAQAQGAGILSALGLCTLTSPPRTDTCGLCIPATKTCLGCPESVNTCASICDLC